MATYFADHTAKEEVVQLAENEERRGENVEPHRADLIEDREHDVGHQSKVYYDSSKFVREVECRAGKNPLTRRAICS